MRTIDRIRFILNVLFLIATVATFIMWLTDSGMFFYTGITALTLKGFEFILRFVN
ncbi:MAG: hypothetical protein IKY85_03005 [Bacteroidaceae bacterium]|nr:hypothetical protein [Bacteroidaceae bacterium]